MNVEEARAALVDLVQPALPPTLGTDELDRVLARALVPDADGLPPSDAAYVPTYAAAGVYAAAAAALQIRQAKLLHTAIDHAGDAGTFAGNQLMANLTTLIREYQRYAVGTLGAKGPPVPAPDLVFNRNDPYADAP